MKTIEAAKDRKGAEPADAFIEKIMSGTRQKDVERAINIAIRFDEYARTGRLRGGTLQLKNLRAGIREIKAGDVRLLFYDATAQSHQDLLRLTNGFLKTGDNTPLRHIRYAVKIREEDRAQ